MNKKILYITNSLNEINTLGYRHSNILKHITTFFNIDLLNFEFTKKNSKKLLINYLFILTYTILIYLVIIDK